MYLCTTHPIHTKERCPSWQASRRWRLQALTFPTEPLQSVRPAIRLTHTHKTTFSKRQTIPSHPTTTSRTKQPQTPAPRSTHLLFPPHLIPQNHHLTKSQTWQPHFPPFPSSTSAFSFLMSTMGYCLTPCS